MPRPPLLSFVFAVSSLTLFAQSTTKQYEKLEREVTAIEQQVIQWRRYFHEHPELSNHETETGKKIADILTSFGLEVQYPVARTGVVALLKTNKQGPVVALRADMDALPITERNALPFASKQKVIFNGQQTGVMHACGHDAHMAMLLGTAQILAKHKDMLRGTVKFIFQPAEEGVSPDEAPAGAELMIKEGVLDNPEVNVVFGLHIQSMLPSGQIAYREGGLMAAVDNLDIRVKGVGAHGATPWDSVDPIVVSGQIIQGIQTIVSRQSPLTEGAVVITVGSVHAGIRRNIIPEEAVLEGTIRTFSDDVQEHVHTSIHTTATKIAESAGASAEVKIHKMYPATINHPALTQQSVKSLQRAAGKANTVITQPVTMAEDFSFYQRERPGLFFFLGAYPAEMSLSKQPIHHTADFMIDEKSFSTGVKAFLFLTLDYMNSTR